MPSKKPLFPATHQVRPTGTGSKIGENMLVSWVNLSKFLPLSARSLKQLIIVESEGRNRPYMLKRLIARLHTTERQDLYKRLGL